MLTIILPTQQQRAATDDSLPGCAGRQKAGTIAHMSGTPGVQTMQQWAGLLRSIAVYYGNPVKLRRMQRFYAQFIQPGDLCFDLGAHVGNRLLVWSRLGARVVGVEPQPACIALLRRWYGRSPSITLVEEAVGAAPGEATLMVSARTPTVTTLSQNWIDAVRQSESFAAVRWENAVTVQVTTLDDLIAAFVGFANRVPFYGTAVLCLDDPRVRFELLLVLADLLGEPDPVDAAEPRTRQHGDP